MNREEMENGLVASGIFKKKDLRRLTEDEVQKTYEVTMSANSVLAALEVPVDNVQVIPIGNVEGDSALSEKITTPEPSDPNWTPYVLSLFEKDEVDAVSGMPRVDGLRRVALKLFGLYDSTIIDICQTPTPENGKRATVIVKIRFHRDKREIMAAADACSDNTDAKFAIHPVSIAETRAEGRALRKAMYLVRVLAAEELQKNRDSNASSVLQDDFEVVRDRPINSNMLTSLHMMCERQGLDLHKLAVRMDFDISTPEDLSHQEGLKISDQLSKFQKGKDKIPDEVRR